MKTNSYLLERRNPMVLHRNYGVSSDAKSIREKSDESKQNFARTISFGDKLSHIIEELIRVKHEYSRENWDGYGAKSIDILSYDNALSFALSIPTNIPSPEVDVIPTGKVVFTWSEGKRKLFSVIIGNLNELSYAGLYGAISTYGVEFFSDGMPETIVKNISRVYS